MIRTHDTTVSSLQVCDERDEKAVGGKKDTNHNKRYTYIQKQQGTYEVCRNYTYIYQN